jgi:dsRNA-specific ribonuclease
VSSDFRPEFHSRYNCPYERLEFLGDAVLSFLIASSSYLKLPITAREDFLHGTRVEIAKNETLGKIARHANFDSLLLSAFDLTQLEEEYKNKIVADCFEALLGALYKDSESDVTSCRTLFNKLLQSFDAELADLVLLTNEEIALKCQEVSTIDQEAISQSPSYHEILQLHEKFQLKTQIPLKNIALWLQCMTHNSFKDAEVDDPEKVFITSDPNYERIEFLGDAVLQLLSSDFLVTCLPFQQENFLTRARSSLVKNKRLAKVAFNLGFQEFIRVGKNARREAQHLHWDDVYADVFEAILGALFLENKSSLKQVNQVLKRTLFPLLEDSITRREWMNPIEVISHHMNQWNKNTMKKASCYFKKIPEMNHGGHQEDQSLHGIALYVEFGSNKFLIARARARSIATAKQLACKRALKMYGIKWLPDTLHNK